MGSMEVGWGYKERGNLLSFTSFQTLKSLNVAIGYTAMALQHVSQLLQCMFMYAADCTDAAAQCLER